MNRKRFVLNLAAMAAVLCMCVSCDNSLYTIMARSAADPFYDVPEARSFDEELTVHLSWKDDEAADMYILRRSQDDRSPMFDTIIYQGNGTSYVDREIAKDTRYLYRLDKIRGNRTFTGKTSALAACSPVKKDIYEDNDSIERATQLTSKCNANLYYYPFVDGRVLEDRDWYKVSIPPRANAVITLTEIDLPVTSTETAFVCTIDSFHSFIVSDVGTITIENTSDETVIIPFMLTANKEYFKKYHIDGTIRSYTLKLASIVYQ